jgi:Tol biopolymer transport system component
VRRHWQSRAATNRWGDLEIALISPDGTTLRRVTNSPGLDDSPAWTPDGKIGFDSNCDGGFDVDTIEPPLGFRGKPSPE